MQTPQVSENKAVLGEKGANIKGLQTEVSTLRSKGLSLRQLQKEHKGNQIIQWKSKQYKRWKKNKDSQGTRHGGRTTLEAQADETLVG